MGIFNFKKKATISPEKIVAMAENGYIITDLSRKEKEYLINGGLEEINAIKSYVYKKPTKESSVKIRKLLDEFFPPGTNNEKSLTTISLLNEIHLKFHKANIDLLSLSAKWEKHSLAFDHKGKKSDSISFSKNLNNHAVHVEIVSKDQNTADINIRLNDKSGKHITVFEAELCRNEICIVSASTKNKNTIHLYSVEFGKYILKVSDSKKCLTSILIHLE